VALAGVKIWLGGRIGRFLITTFGQQGLTSVSNLINFCAQVPACPALPAHSSSAVLPCATRTTFVNLSLCLFHQIWRNN
jgi:hypothetical protein